MKRFLPVAFLLASLPACAQTPEDLFRKMERRLADAKSWDVKFQSQMPPGAIQRVEATGSLATGPSGHRFSVESLFGVKRFKLAIEAKDQQLTLVRSEQPEPPVPLPPQPQTSVPANLAANLRIAFARGGQTAAQEYMDLEFRRHAEDKFRQLEPGSQPTGNPPPPPPPALDLSKSLILKDFREGKPADIGKVRASAVQYQVIPQGNTLNLKAQMTVWIDPQSFLPLRREFRLSGGDVVSTVTENYTEWKTE